MPWPEVAIKKLSLEWHKRRAFSKIPGHHKTPFQFQQVLEYIFPWVGHAMTSFSSIPADAIDAVAFAMHLQEAMLEVAWPDEILANPHACLVTTASGQKLFNGLRVRMAIHTGTPSSIRVWLLYPLYTVLICCFLQSKQCKAQ